MRFLIVGVKGLIIAALAGVALMLSSGAAMAASFSAPLQVDVNPNGYSQTLPDASFANGDTALSWVEYSNDASSIVTKVVNRDGNSVGAKIVVQSIANDVPGQDSWFGRTVTTALSNNKVQFAWFEHTQNYTGPFDVSSWVLKTRTVGSGGELGGVVTVAQNQIAENLGRDSAQALALNTTPGAGSSSLVWGIGQARGSDCGSYYSSVDCVYTPNVNGAILNGDGNLASPVVNLHNQPTEQNYGQLRVTSALDGQGVATAVWTVGHERGGEYGLDHIYRQFTTGGARGNSALLTWTDSSYFPQAEADQAGNVSVVVGSRIFRLNPDGSAVAPVTVGDSGQNDYPISDVAVNPNGTATATWSSVKGVEGAVNRLDYSVWTRQLDAGGALGTPNSILTRSIDRTKDENVSFYLEPSIAIGRGVDTGVLGITSGHYVYNTITNVSSFVGGFQATPLLSNGTSTGVSTLGGANSVGGDVSAADDGTIEGSWVDEIPSSAVEITNISKIPGGTTCGYIPENCVAAITKVQVTPAKKTLKAGQKVKLTAKVTNTGTAPASNVKITFKSSNKKVKAPKPVTIPSIGVGAIGSKTATVSVGKSAKGKATITASYSKSVKDTAKLTIKAKKKKKGKGGKKK